MSSKQGLVKQAGNAMKKASPTILTCLGAIGVVVTAVLAVKATPKAMEMVKADSRKNHNGDPNAATKVALNHAKTTNHVMERVIGVLFIFF